MEASELFLTPWFSVLKGKNKVMEILLLSSCIGSFLLIAYFVLRHKRVKKSYQLKDEIDPKTLDEWKKQRRKDNREISLDVRAMGENIEKSHELWKALSILVHESKWFGENEEKQRLAEELRVLINQNKENYQELRILEQKVKQGLFAGENT